MNKQEIESLIGFGFTPSDALKRSTWNKVTRVMDYLVSKGIIARKSGSVKYQKNDGSAVTQQDIECMAKMYLTSPLHEHVDELRMVARQHGIAVNNGKIFRYL